MITEAQTEAIADKAPAPTVFEQQADTSRARRRLAWLRVREYLEYQSPVLRPLICLAVWVVGAALLVTPFRSKGFGLLATLHRSGRVRWTNGLVESLVRRGAEGPLRGAIDRAVASADAGVPKGLQDDPRNVFPTLAIVLRSPSDDAKGVLNMTYNYAYPWFHRHFDVPRIAERYHLVLEPSWAGFCTPELLSFTRLDAPVFVQAIEPYDSAFLTRIGSNLVPVPIAANWWTDASLFAPEPGAERDLDFVMVASWADFKRHHRFFSALRKLNESGRPLRGACIGYPQGRSVADIGAVASVYGVEDCVAFYDRLTPDETAACVRRAKVKVLWSRREGFNRAVIEALFSDTPIVMRSGFNYGHHHDYINQQTGFYTDDASLPRVLQEFAVGDRPVAPRAWVEAHMTPEAAVVRLHQSIANTVGETMTTADELSVKVNRLSTMAYKRSTDADKYAEDYRWLKECRL